MDTSGCRQVEPLFIKQCPVLGGSSRPTALKSASPSCTPTIVLLNYYVISLLDLASPTSTALFVPRSCSPSLDSDVVMARDCLDPLQLFALKTMHVLSSCNSLIVTVEGVRAETSSKASFEETTNESETLREWPGQCRVQ
eukprot:SAG31_NODE_162_length_21892_cov_343.171936_22_plen_140_part_00